MKRKWLDLLWHQVRDSVEVKLYPHEGELYVLARTPSNKTLTNLFCGEDLLGKYTDSK